MAYKKWIFSEVDKEKAKILAEECNIEPFLALLLYSRGYTDPFDLDIFLSKDMPDFEPFSFLDMEIATERINLAVEKQEKILIYGDYDCDGVTSTALMYKFLKSSGAVVDYYIPSRHDEGYGMSLSRIERLAEEGVNLIITVDNGINSLEEIRRAKQLGMDIIVTDHHIQSGELPDAIAVINPHRTDSTLDFKDFAGVGVAFMLIMAVSGLSPNILLNKYSDLVALGTVADVMPLKGENRSLVWFGINKINRNPSTGIKALFAAAGAKFGEINAGTVAFTAAPRVNAAGRLGDAKRAVELLISDDYATSFEIAANLDDENRNRQTVEQNIVFEAEKKVFENKLYNNRVMVVAGEDWHEGVLGIAAARLAEKFSKPTILLTLDTETGIAKGSARSVGDFSIYEAISEAGEYLTKFGGHEKAAGLSLEIDNIENFNILINEKAKNQAYPVGDLKIDCRLNPAAITPDLVRTLTPLEPFGTGNPKPVFALMGMKIINAITIGKGKHLRIVAEKQGTTVAMVLFGMNEESFPFKAGDILDFAVTVELKDYQGEERLSVLVKDFRKFGENIDYCGEMTVYEEFLQGKLTDTTAKKLLFDRKELAPVYRNIREGCNTFLKLRQVAENIPLSKLLVMTDIMEELGLIKTEGYFDEKIITINNTEKVDLENSKGYQSLLH